MKVVKLECIQRCPQIAGVVREVDPQYRAQAISTACEFLGAAGCQGLGFSMETASNHRCQAPDRVGSENGEELAELVIGVLSESFPEAEVRNPVIAK